jgi:hypothetical protein
VCFGRDTSYNGIRMLLIIVAELLPLLLYLLNKPYLPVITGLLIAKKLDFESSFKRFYEPQASRIF